MSHSRYSLLPALSLDGILHVKIVEGSFTTVLFKEFLEGLLDQMQPFPAPNSVIVLDNARIHRHPDITAMIEARYVLYLHYLIYADPSTKGYARPVSSTLFPRLQPH